MANEQTSMNIEGQIDNNYLTEHFIADVPKNGAKPSWLYLGDGIEQAEAKVEDKKNSKAYYNTGGQERTSVTGVTKSKDFSGDRSIGNPAQDKIAAIQSETGTKRISLLRINQYTVQDDGKLALTESEEGAVTWSDITADGGNANDAKSFKATASYNAKPKVLHANVAEDATKLATVLTETPSINAELADTEAIVQGSTDGGTGEGNTPS